MAVITRLYFRGTDEVIVRRAPRNKVFLVEAIQISVQTNLDQTIYILSRHLKPGQNSIIGIVDTDNNPDTLATFHATVSTAHNSNLMVTDINEKTKYISVAYQNASGLNFIATVYGQIIFASKSDLIWEFITKRHR